MALRLALKDLVRATLPQGGGQMGFIGFAPGGEAYHLLVPVDLERAQALSALSAQNALSAMSALAEPAFDGQRTSWCLRPGWRYLPCRTYSTPLPCGQGRPGQEAFLQARRIQAQITAAQITAWASRQGWWVNIE